MLSSMRSISLTLLLIAVCVPRSDAQQPVLHEDAQYYNVSKPVPNLPYVTGQKLPLVYRVSADSTASTLQLSIVLQDAQNVTNRVVMVQNANIAKGFSEQVIQGDVPVYEHQENYDIPLASMSGSYNVVYINGATNHNVSIPITIASANTAKAAVPTSTSAAGTKKSIWDSGALTHYSFISSTWTALCLAALIACCL